MKLFIDAKELSITADISISEARKIIQLVNTDMEQEGYYIPKSKKLIAPTERVMKKIGANNGTFNR